MSSQSYAVMAATTPTRHRTQTGGMTHPCVAILSASLGRTRLHE